MTTQTKAKPKKKVATKKKSVPKKEKEVVHARPKNTAKQKEEPRFPKPDEKFDFPVEFQRVKTASGILVPNKRAIVRTDTKKVLGVVGSDYKIVRNRDVIQQIEKKLPVALKTRKIHVCNEGKYMFARYMSPKIKPINVQKGDMVQFGIEIGNAYTGKMSIVMRMFALQLVCSNGLTTPRSVSTIQVRHVSNSEIKLTEAREAFEQKVELFHTYSKRWVQWTKIVPKPATIGKFMKSHIGSQRGRDIVVLKYEAGKDKSLWGLFSAVTWYGTHVLKPKYVTEKGSNIGGMKTAIPTHRDAAKLQFRFAKRVIEPFYEYNWK